MNMKETDDYDDEFKYMPLHVQAERRRLRDEGRTIDSIQEEMIALLKRDPQKAWSLDPLLTALNLPLTSIAGRDIIIHLLNIHVLRWVRDEDDLRVKLFLETDE